MTEVLIGFDAYYISCIIGVYPEERKKEQEILVDLRVGHLIGKEDDLSKTLCYVELATLCRDLARAKQYKLLETFAADAIEAILARYGERKIWIRIRKPQGLPSAAATVIEATWDGP